MSILDKLRAWGRTKAINEPPNGYPCIASFAREMRSPGKATLRAAPIITEMEHEKIDRAVSDLHRAKPLHYEIICYAYIKNRKDGEIGRLLKLSRSSVRSKREAAEYWIDARLFD